MAFMIDLAEILAPLGAILTVLGYAWMVLMVPLLGAANHPGRKVREPKGEEAIPCLPADPETLEDILSSGEYHGVRGEGLRVFAATRGEIQVVPGDLVSVQAKCNNKPVKKAGYSRRSRMVGAVRRRVIKPVRRVTQEVGEVVLAEVKVVVNRVDRFITKARKAWALVNRIDEVEEALDRLDHLEGAVTLLEERDQARDRYSIPLDEDYRVRVTVPGSVRFR